MKKIISSHRRCEHKEGFKATFSLIEMKKKMKNELSCGIQQEVSMGGVATVVDRIYGTKLNLM